MKASWKRTRRMGLVPIPDEQPKETNMRKITKVYADDTMVGCVITGHMREVRKLVEQTEANNKGACVWTETVLIGE